MHFKIIKISLFTLFLIEACFSQKKKKKKISNLFCAVWRIMSLKQDIFLNKIGKVSTKYHYLLIKD